MIAPVTHILPLTRIRRSRMLPGKGDVLVMTGDTVTATEVVAEANLPGAHLLLDVRRMLGLKSPAEIPQYIERKVGDRVEKGDIIAQIEGIFSRVVRAPAAAEIVAIQKGQVLLELIGDKFELLAGVNGTVSEVLPERGAIIEANGALIQGVWGNHQVAFGTLTCLAEAPDSELKRASIENSLRGVLIAAGHVVKDEVLTAANQLPIAGMILAGMASDLVPTALKVKFPIMLVEGFGHLPMNSKAFQLLNVNNKREASLNAGWEPLLGERPELLIPLPAEGNPVLNTSEFLPGKTVRIHSMPLTGAIGTIITTRPGQPRLANGLRAPVADVRLENGRTLTIPLVNMDVLE